MVIYIINLNILMLFEEVKDSDYPNETKHIKGQIHIFNNIYIYIYILDKIMFIIILLLYHIL